MKLTVMTTLVVCALGVGFLAPAAPVASSLVPSIPHVHRSPAVKTPGTVVPWKGENGLKANFTVGSRTVTYTGAERTFTESTTKATVKHNYYVKLLADPFKGEVSQAEKDWLKAASSDDQPDLLADAMQYTTDQPKDAHYGPKGSDGVPVEGADWNDYLGETASYPDGKSEKPDANEKGSLDCSGFVRMVFGHDFGVPMSLNLKDGSSLPRRAVNIEKHGPGVQIITNGGKTPSSKTMNKILPGDLLFWVHTDPKDKENEAIDHVGIFVGKDSDGKLRFVSSRKYLDGPTMGDYGKQTSLLDSPGSRYTQGFRSTRRI